MLDISIEEREAFASRLQQALLLAGRPDIGITELARLFNAHYKGAPISVHAVRKWLVAEAIPTQAKLLTLANILRVEAQWLRYGDGAMGSEGREPGSLDAADARLLSDLHSLNEQAQTIARDFVRMLARTQRR